MRLNMATRPCHAEVDEPWLDLLRLDVGRADYLAVLVRTYGLVAPFESACKYTPHLEREVDLRQLSRAGLLAQDLLSLGLTPSQVAHLPQCLGITTFRNIAEALGWLYVIERSTLLSDGIRRHLLRHVFDVEHACAYLSMNEGTVAEQWSVFGRQLDRLGAKPEMANEVMTAAHAGFDCVKNWYRGATANSRRSTG